MGKRILAILIIVFAILLICLIKRVIRKIRKSATERKQREEVKGAIYKTTDGYFADNPKNKKERRVVAVEQRKKDGAIAVSKIYGADDKNEKNVIDNLVLKPENHKSLTQDSVVGKRVYFGVKRKGTHTPIQRKDLTATNDRLTKKEMRQLNKQKGGKTAKNKKTYRNTRKKWKQGFKNKQDK